MLSAQGETIIRRNIVALHAHAAAHHRPGRVLYFISSLVHISNYASVFLASLLRVYVSSGGDFHIPASRATKIHTPAHALLCVYKPCSCHSKSLSWAIHTIQHSRWSEMGRKEDNIRINRCLWSIKRVARSWILLLLDHIVFSAMLFEMAQHFFVFTWNIVMFEALQ